MRVDPWVGKIPEVGHGNPLQCASLENPMDRGAWWATVHGVAKCRTLLSNQVHAYIQSRTILFLVFLYPIFSCQMKFGLSP